MAVQVIEDYSTEKEAIQAADVLCLKGYKVEQITLFTKHSRPSELKKLTDIKVVSHLLDHEPQDTLLNQIKKRLNKEKQRHFDMSDELKNLGLSSEQITTCLEKILTGKVLIIAHER